MNPKVKTKWTDALRSGRYQQGNHALRNGDLFCCLGVLCDLHAKETGVQWDSGSYNRYAEILPPNVIEWAELEDGNPTLNEPDGETLAELNDAGYPFDRIADLIESNL